MSAFGGIYTTRKFFYTACGSDGSDKSHLCDADLDDIVNVDVDYLLWLETSFQVMSLLMG